MIVGSDRTPVSSSNRGAPPSPPFQTRLRHMVRAMRPHQWPKNALVFVPLVTAHLWNVPSAFLMALWCAAAFSLAASAVYLLNDTLDAPADRLHERKCHRPIAAGLVSPQEALWAALICAATALVPPVASGRPELAGVLAAYIVLGIAYSAGLKSVLVADVLVLAGFYLLRILAGAMAVGVPVSFWLLAFSLFFFLGLAFAKRFAGLGRAGGAVRRPYTESDAMPILVMGVGCSFLAVLVLALYIDGGAVEGLYKTPEWMWLVCVLVLGWSARLWLLVHRGVLQDDPVAFALSDRASWMLGGVCAVCFLLGVLGTGAR